MPSDVADRTALNDNEKPLETDDSNQLEADTDRPGNSPAPAPEPAPPPREVRWRNPFTSRLYLNILWSLIPPALLVIIITERISLGYTHSWITHSIVMLCVILLIVAAVCSSILRPLSELLRAQTRKLDRGSEWPLVADHFASSDEIGDLIRNHNRIINQIRDVKERHQGLLEGLNAIIYEANANTHRFTYVSPQIESILGYPQSTWSDDPGSWVHQLHPEDRPTAVSKWLNVPDSANGHSIEYRLKRADGQYVWVRDIVRTTHRIDLTTGKSYRQLQGIIFDITEEKDVEFALRLNEARFRSIFDCAGIGMAVAGHDGRLQQCNSALERLLGYSRDELMSMTLRDVTHPEDLENDWSEFQKVMTGARDGYKLEKRFITKDQRTVWVNLTASMARTGDGDPGVLIGMVEDITERKRAEESLKTFKMAIDHAGDAMFWLDADGSFRYVNRAAQQSLGYSETELLSMHVWDIDPLMPEERWPSTFRELRFKSEMTFETIHQRRDGTRFPVQISASLLELDGEVLICAFARDITSQKESENRLRDSESRYRALLEHAGLGIGYFDLDGRCLLMNKRGCEVMQSRADALVGRTVTEMFGETLGATIMSRFSEVSVSGHRRTYEDEGDLAGGHFWFRSTYAPIANDDGGVNGILIISEDITRIKQNELALQESHERVIEERDLAEQYLDMAGSMILVTDLTGRIITINRHACELLGYDRSELIGRDAIELLVSPHQQESVKELLARGVRGEVEDHQAWQNELRTKSGETLTIIWQNAAIRDAGGNIVKFILSGTDITSRLRMQEELHAKTELLHTIVANIPAAVFWKDVEGRYLGCNQQFAQAARLNSPEDIVGKTDYELPWTSEETEYYRACDHRVVESGMPMLNVEETRRGPDGETLNILTHKVPLKDDSGRVIGVLGVFIDITDRIEAERALAASERHYRTLFENAQDIIAVIGSGGVIEYSSPSLARTLGHEPESFANVNIHDLLHPEDANGYRNIEREVLEEGLDNRPFEFRLRHRDSSYRILGGMFGLLPGIDGTPRMVVNARDVTERREEDVIQDVLSRISQATNITENLNDLLQFTHRQVARIMDAYNFRVALYDERKGMYTCPYFVDEVDEIELNTPTDLSGTLTDGVRITGEPLIINESAQHGAVQSGHLRAIGRLAKSWMGVPLKTLGEVFGVMVVQSYDEDTIYTPRDLKLLQRLADRISLVVERKRSDDDRKRLAIAVEQSVEAIMVTDTEGVIQYVNPSFERITGYSRDEILGETPRLLKSGQHTPEFYRGMWSKLQSGEQWTGRIINRRKDGSLYQEDATISPVRDSEGLIVNYVAVKRDITQELQLETQLRQAQKLEAVGSLAAGIAHEINTPIQFIGDNVRFMSDSFNDLLTMLDTASDLREKLSAHTELQDIAAAFDQAYQSADVDYLRAEIPRAIDQTLDGVQRVASIVRAMKDFSHPDKGEKSAENINRALESTLTVARNELKYVADVVTDLQPDLPPVWCHISELNQVFLNLLVNAAHAIGDKLGANPETKGTITVRSFRSGDNVIIEIGDTGAGIPEELRDRIFDPFFTTKPVGRGTGQGLAISRSVVVDKHGGSLTFESEVGVGSTFRISLPIESRTETQEPGSAGDIGDDC
ncbi:MAG: hypothetical protein Kow0074_06170 [Candidatus Zixiibacteriota bacterium]